MPMYHTKVAGSKICSDVGIVTTPNKRHFLMAIYVYRDLNENGGDLQDSCCWPSYRGICALDL
jgi:hypothetical protein